MANKKILITSALPYVNNVPHLGNIIGSVLSADVFARFNRLVGNETLYICGTDEHGTATETKALEEDLTPKQVCDKYYKIHKDIYDWFNISFDYFGRTSKKEHHQITQGIFKKLDKKGFITEEEVQQLYCIKGKHFLADRYVEGKCPFCKYEQARGDQCENCGKLLTPKELVKPHCKIHRTAPVEKKTKHLFLDLPKLSQKLKAWVKKQSKDGFWSKNAVTTTNAWLKEGLEKRAITRDLKWGIKVPKKGYENKVFYVWFDAPIGYVSITAQLTSKWEEWWKNPKDVLLYQFMAKDNIPFHTIVFPASLIGTGENYTLLHHINSTEYLQYEDGKFSKSRHIGVFGDDAKNTGIPSDVFRYYLLSNRPENADTVFCWKEFGKRLNNELVANIGNFVNRVLAFIDKYQNKKITKQKLSNKELDFWEEIQSLENTAAKQLEKVEIKNALKTIMKISQAGNQYFQECQPWKTVKENKELCSRSLYLLSNLVKDIAILLAPYLPDTSKKIFSQLNIKEKNWDDLGKLSVENHKIGKPEILFKKIDVKKIKELQEKFAGKDHSDFDKLNLKVGKVIDAKKHPDADKLLILQVDLGKEKRQLVAGIAQKYTLKEIQGKKLVVLTNLEHAKLRGEKSEGMLLAAQKGEDVGVLYAKDSKPGDQILIEGAKPSSKTISFKDFLKIRLNSKNGHAFYKNKEFFSGKEKVSVDKVKNGRIC